MKIKLIGGSGFIGHNVYEYLKNTHEVEVIDIKNDKNIDNFVFCDVVTERDRLSKLLENVDIVYMFAALSEATKNYENPYESIDKNILGLHNVLKACVDSKVKRVVFSSTSWVYSECEDEIVNEDTTCLNANYGTNIYSATKICGEVLIRSYQKSYGLDYTICRYGTIFGEGSNPRTAVATFLRKAVNDEPITLTSDGYRNFIHVKDLARTVSNIPDKLEETRNETINIDGIEGISLTQVVSFIKEKIPNLNATIELNNIKEFKGKVLDLKKSINLLDYKQTIKLRDWIHSQIKI
jgi:nucleoside-diphosphate-sugar epimerase